MTLRNSLGYPSGTNNLQHPVLKNKQQENLLSDRVTRWLQPGKPIRLVYFQPIAQWLPNGLPNLTGVLAIAIFRVGKFHVQAELRLPHKNGRRYVKIASVYDLARRKRASRQVCDHLLVSLRVKMVTCYVRTSAKSYVPKEGHNLCSP